MEEDLQGAEIGGAHAQSGDAAAGLRGEYAGGLGEDEPDVNPRDRILDVKILHIKIDAAGISLDSD